MYAEFLCECATEMRCETGISVADDSFGQSKPSVQMIEIEFGDLGSCYCGRTREEDCASGASMVDDRKDGVVPFTVRKSSD